MAQNSQPNFWIFLCPQNDLQRNHLVKPEDQGKRLPYNECQGSPESLTMSMQEWPPTDTRLLCNWCLFGREAGGQLTDLRTRELQNIQWVLTGQSQGPIWDSSWDLGSGWGCPNPRTGEYTENRVRTEGAGAPQPLCKESTLILSTALPKAWDLSLVKPLDPVADMQGTQENMLNHTVHLQLGKSKRWENIIEQPMFFKR